VGGIVGVPGVMWKVGGIQIKTEYIPQARKFDGSLGTEGVKGVEEKFSQETKPKLNY